MPFPLTERVIYDKNPLANVICQLRFPAILKIDSEEPAAFQERIRADYPLYAAHRVEMRPFLPPEIAAQRPAEFPAMMSGSRHEFQSADGYWNVTLARDSIALSTTKYERWRTFRSRLDSLCVALNEVYAIPFYTRLGLRYQDLIQRSALGIGDAKWSELLKPQILSVLSAEDIEGSVAHFVAQAVINIPDINADALLAYGFAQIQNSEEIGFLIDSDFFREERTENSHVLTSLDDFNKQAGRVFRWCITERLHNAMSPRPLAPESED